MIYEKSCGAVIFYEEGEKCFFLIEHMVKGHTSLCKGHVEGRETEHETAAREIREETNLAVSFTEGFRECIEYSPYPGCMKEVVFFLAKAESLEVSAQPEEVSRISWMTLDEALKALTHKSDREVLKKAAAYLGTNVGMDILK